MPNMKLKFSIVLLSFINFRIIVAMKYFKNKYSDDYLEVMFAIMGRSNNELQDKLNFVSKTFDDYKESCQLGSFESERSNRTKFFVDLK